MYTKLNGDIYMNNVTGIILVAGNSTRYGKGTNKNFEILNDKYVISYSLDVFNNNDYIDDIIIVIRKDDIDIIKNIIDNTDFNKPIKCVFGGNSRQESVYNALLSTDSRYVVIHDGARPLIKQRYIDDCVCALDKYDGALVGVVSKDTVKIVDENMEIISSTNRNNTYLAQTPQCFNRSVLLELHEKYKNYDNIFDDCMLLERENKRIKMVKGDYSNIKITTHEDLDIAKKYLKC